jgi:glycosyltransferase involved in cell wall biosynthesis
MRISLLTGGMDSYYQLDLVAGLVSAGVYVEFVCNDEMAASEIARHELVAVYNLRGDQDPDAPLAQKLARILAYYIRLLWYSARTRSRVFHIQWENKFLLFDRTLLCLFYKLLGKTLVFTAHNVNAGKRDGTDSWRNRFGLRVMYRLVDHIIVHTSTARDELIREFDVPEHKVSAIECGVNRIVPKTPLSREEAKRQLGLTSQEKAVLFFGNILPYKGLEYLVDAVRQLLRQDETYRLIIAGRSQLHKSYWREKIEPRLADALGEKVILRTSLISDEGVEVYFKAADVLVLPYLMIFQSGVLFVAYAFGLPVIASDVGAFRDDIVSGKTGYICLPRDVTSLAEAIAAFFSGPLFTHHEESRRFIAEYAADRYSWEKIGQKTKEVYAALTRAASN